ncbi:MAG: [FeFe] hydrogenase H-cluster maturation GTPase HydF [Lachnospiraceae bacterium]
MGMNQTPASERIHIGFFGRRNAGKSSVMNAVTGQNLSVVSEVKGTTTDPVYKAMELLPLGPVVLIDTPGIDDEGELGDQRVKKSYQVLNKTDVALLIIDDRVGKTKEDQQLLERFQKKKIPYLIVHNKMDLGNQEEKTGSHDIWVSAKTGAHIYELKEAIAKLQVQEESKQRIVGDLLTPSDFVILVIPIDESAPKGRLILPQQQTIRDILESNAVAIAVKENELSETLRKLGTKPKMVITDSQVFQKVAAETPKDIWLTSFSILFARYKGDLLTVAQGAKALDHLKDGDTILISEGCTHHRQCNDIGTVKIPGWIQKYTGKQIALEFTAGTEFPEDLSKYGLIVHCGGCMLNEREMKYRIQCAEDQGIPITNYGILIAYIQGILKRSVEPFSDIVEALQET